MSYPTDNHVLNLIWIGEKPLPNAELKTLIQYASTKILPLILWTDYPNRICSQLADVGFSYNMTSLIIAPIHDLFISNQSYVGRNKDEQKLSLILDSLQTREAFGEGNIGARVDLIKVQILYHIGGIFSDFDKLDALYEKNKAIYQFDTIIHLMTKFKQLIEENQLLFETKKGQPDFIVAARQTNDTQILRMIQLEGARFHSQLPKNPQEQEKKESLEDKIFSSVNYFDEPLTDALVYVSARDFRRSHQGWNEANFSWSLGETQSARLTINETGGFLLNFLPSKTAIEQHSTSLYHQKQKIRMNLGEIKFIQKEVQNNSLGSQKLEKLKKKEQELLEEQKSLREHYSAVCNKIYRTPLQELKRYSVTSFFQNLNFPRDIYRNSWEHKIKKKPSSYLLEGTNFFVKRKPWKEVLQMEQAETLLLKKMYQQGLINPDLMKILPRIRFKKIIAGTENPIKFLSTLNSAADIGISDPSTCTLNFGTIDSELKNPNIIEFFNFLKRIGVTINLNISSPSDSTEMKI